MPFKKQADAIVERVRQEDLKRRRDELMRNKILRIKRDELMRKRRKPAPKARDQIKPQQ